MGALIFCCSFLIYFFLKLIVACRLCVIYVREDNDSNVWAMITQMLVIDCNLAIWQEIFTIYKSPRCIWNYVFDGILSCPSYSELIQNNLWRIEPWHWDNIQDNGLVWHLWFDSTGFSRIVNTIACVKVFRLNSVSAAQVFFTISIIKIHFQSQFSQCFIVTFNLAIDLSSHELKIH